MGDLNTSFKNYHKINKLLARLDFGEVASVLFVLVLDVSLHRRNCEEHDTGSCDGDSGDVKSRIVRQIRII